MDHRLSGGPLRARWPRRGSFTSGGAEANASALHLALSRAIPDMATAGLAAPGVRPTLYASSESHLAWLKIAHVSGVGRDAVRLVPTDARLRMDPDALRRLMAEDTAAGHRPVLIVGTAGTSSAGVVDPLTELAGIAADYGCLFHVDAAWAGAAVLSDRLRPHDTRLGPAPRGLLATGWSVRNHTPLPVVCFADPYRLGDDEHHRRIAADVVESAAAWLSTTIIGGEPCLRACICSHRTTDGDVDALVTRLAAARTG